MNARINVRRKIQIMTKLHYVHNERGFALVVALMLLITLTVLGLATLSTTTTEIQIAANERVNAEALHAAEAGVNELLYRMSLPSGSPAVLVQDGGSQVNPNGTAFDARIDDPGKTTGSISGVNCTNDTPCPDTAWQHTVFFDNTVVQSGTQSPTIVPVAEWGELNYSGVPADPAGTILTVSYMRESDISLASPPASMNEDSDVTDFVYYDRNAGNRVVANLGINGVAAADGIDDIPAGYTKNDAILLITSTGKRGQSSKRLQVEVARISISPNVNASVSLGATSTFTGNSFISGLNHAADLDFSTDENIVSSDTTCGGTDPWWQCNSQDNSNVDGAGDEAGQNPEKYSSKILPPGSDHKPGAALSPDTNNDPTTLTTTGSNETWGEPWQAAGNPPWSELYQILNLSDQAALNELLNSANQPPNPNSYCPQGFVYINNVGGSDYNPPACSDGWGLLYVTGNMRAQSLNFKGMIFVEGSARITGAFRLLGAMAIRADLSIIGSNNPFGAGNGAFLYSRDTLQIQLTRAIESASGAMTVLAWREIQ